MVSSNVVRAILMTCVIVTIVPTSLSQGNFGLAASYTNRLIPSLNRRLGFGGSGTGIGTGVGDRVGGAGIGGGVGVAGDFDRFGNARQRGFDGRFARCGSLSPACLPSPLDTQVECKFVYDPSLGECVKIDVILACAGLQGAANNLFNTLLECQTFCL